MQLEEEKLMVRQELQAQIANLERYVHMVTTEPGHVKHGGLLSVTGTRLTTRCW